MKRIPRQQEEEFKEKAEEQTRLVNAAMNAGKSKKKDICEAAGIEMWQLNKLFKADKDLHASFTVRRRTLVDTAADNMAEIIGDKNHPSHFAASKFILQRYKSDLDTSLISHDAEEIEIEIPGTGKSKNKPVIIRFGKKNKDE